MMKSPEVVFQKGSARVIKFSPQTPWPPRHSNAYLIEDDPPTLVDCGIFTSENYAQIEKYINSRGIKLQRLLITHGHIDHYGSCGVFQDKMGAEVYVHPEDAYKLQVKVSEALERSSQQMRSFYISQGVPEEAVSTSGEMLKVLDAVVIPCRQVKFLREGEQVELSHFNFKVIYVPGHSPGAVVFYEPRWKLLITGDHVLSKKPPTPLIEMTREGAFFNNILYYVDSLYKIKELDVELVLPGHWGIFSDLRLKVEALLRFYQQKKTETLSVLTQERKPLSPFYIARKLFPEMPSGVFFIGVSEVIGYLSLLEREGKVTREMIDGVWHYFPAK